MLGRLREQVTALLSHVEIRRAEPEQAAPPPPPRPVTMRETRRDPALAPAGGNGYDEPPDRGPMASTMVRRTATAFDQGDPATWARTPRNAPCPCGSGKKYKHCHGKVS
jgi:preprotein translocase subunit SecA